MLTVMKTCLSFRGLIVVVTLALAASLQAQAKPDFSGVWTVVADKSDFGPMPPPTSMTRTIVHKDPSIKMTLTQTGGTMGDSTTNLSFTTDGKPQANAVSGSQMTTTAKWEGTAIVMSSTTSMQGADIRIDDRYELAEAGKTLILTRRYFTPAGEVTARLVMTKTK